MTTVENCWEFMRCGREEGGVNTDVLRVCPAYSLDAGQACWLVAGTICCDEAQGTHANNIVSCVYCDFYKQFDVAHKARMSEIFVAQGSKC